MSESEQEVDIERTWVEYEVSQNGTSISFYEEYPNGEVGLRDEAWLTHAETSNALNMDRDTFESGTLE